MALSCLLRIATYVLLLLLLLHVNAYVPTTLIILSSYKNSQATASSQLVGARPAGNCSLGWQAADNSRHNRGTGSLHAASGCVSMHVALFALIRIVFTSMLHKVWQQCSSRQQPTKYCLLLQRHEINGFRSPLQRK